MTAPTVPTLVVAGPFDPSVSVLPLTRQAMVPCPMCDGAGWRRRKLGVDPEVCSLCHGGRVVSFEGPRPIHIAHQCPECEGEGSVPGRLDVRPPCRLCGGVHILTDTIAGSGWVYRSAQAEQVPLKYRVDLEWRLRLSEVSSETAPYLGDVTPGWRA